MELPLARFVAAVESAPDDLRYNLLALACCALGLKAGPCHVVTVDDLRRRLHVVAVDMGVAEAFLIPGLFQFMACYFDGMADETQKLLSDGPQQTVRWLQENRERLPDELRSLLCDQFMQSIMANSAEVAAFGPGYVEDNRRSAAAVRNLWNTWFPPEYWQSRHEWGRFLD